MMKMSKNWKIWLCFAVPLTIATIMSLTHKLDGLLFVLVIIFLIFWYLRGLV